MKEKINNLVGDSIKHLGLTISNVYIDEEDGIRNFNIELEGEKKDLINITEASTIINKLIDKDLSIIENCDVVDVHSKEEG